MRFIKRLRSIGMTGSVVCSLLCALFAIGSAQSAYISEIDLGGPEAPAGQGIELSNVDPASDYTLLILDANPYSTSAFGQVLDVIHLPAGVGLAGVAMVTDVAWPVSTAATTPLASLSPASGDLTLNFAWSRLLVVMQGQSDVLRLDKPLADLAAGSRYDPAVVTDWLVLGDGDIEPLYQTKGHDIADINATLGIDLLDRVINKKTGRVIARTNEPDQAIDMDAFFIGDPDPTSQQFDVDGQWSYTYSPSMSNLPLAAHLPEPNSLAILALSLALAGNRPRRQSGLTAS